MADAELEGTRRWRRAARLGAGKGGEGRRPRGPGTSNRGRSSDRPGERVEFRFSGFRAVQVPVVSDRLLIAIISVDNGKTIAKSSKAAARNGICQWPDSILEPIWFSQDELSKEFQECQYKIVVSMGSTKTAVLGEVILNLTNYLSSSDSTDISSPLKRCNSGTVLQLKIHCLGVKYKSSGKSWNEISPRLDDSSPTNDDMDRKSDGSDSILDKDARLGGAYQDEAGNRDASFSVPQSHRSSNSGDSATGRKNLSPMDSLNEGLYVGRQDSASSYASHDSAGRGDDSSKGLLDSSKETIEELRDAAKMWERHSRKLKTELERLKNDCADKSKQQAGLARELSASVSERDSLRQEIEELKSSLEEVTAHQTIVGTPKSGDVIDLPKEIKDDMQFLIESNASLTAQLNKAQEANMELVSILQELEETIELQRVEMSNLSHMNDVVDQDVSKNELKVQEEAEWARILSLKEDEIAMLRQKLDRILSIENADGAGPDSIYLELEKENDFLKVKIQEFEHDCSELTEENLELIYKLKEVSGVEKGEDSCISNSEEMPSGGRSTSKVKYLEKKCADLELNLLNFRSEFSELEEKFQKGQDELKERTLESSELREKLFHATELEGTETGSARRYQLRSGEPDDTETDLDVLKHTVLLKEQEIDGLQHSTNEMENIISDIQKEKNQLEERLAAALQESSMASKCLDEVREDLLVLTSSVDSHVSANKVLQTKISELESCKVNLESHVSKLEHENIELSEFISELEAQLTSLTSEMESTQLQIDDSVSLITYLKDKIEQQQAEMEAQKLEASGNKVLEMKISELETYKVELELHISKLEHENVELSEFISELEAQLTSVTSEKDSTKLQMDDFRSLITNLKDKVEQQQAEMEAQKLEASANKVLEMKISELESCKVELESHISKVEHENIELSESISELEAQLTSVTSEKESTKLQIDDFRSLITNFKDKIEQQQAEMEAQKLEASGNKVLETKISELESCKVELELHISKLEHEKVELSEFISELEAQLTSVTSEKDSTKLQMDDFRSLITSLKDKVEQQQAEMEAQKLEASANKVLEMKISELESCKVELESHISKVEHENIELSESISELEAQLTSVTSEKESTKLQIDDFRSLITNFKDKVEQQQAEMETQKLELKQKHLESQRRLSEVQEDSEALRRSNVKLQATIDSVVEESNSLQILIADLKRQKLELHDRSIQLEQELEQSKRKTMDFCKMVEFLEARLSSLQKDITSKEQSLLSELENIFQEHKEHEERINRAHFLLNRIENEKIVEVKNLEREVMILTARVSTTHRDQESAALDSIHEVSILRADKAKLEANFEDVNAKMRHYESQLEDLHKESKSKIKGLVDSLNASKQNEETLTTDVEHMRRLMEAARSNEENLRKTSGELELKYKSNDYEKQQIMDEISGLKIQVNKMASLQDEVFKLKSSLDQAKFEKGKLEGLLQSLSEECEELKVQNAMLTDKVSCMQGPLHDAEEENRSKSMQVKLEQGNDDVTNDNGGTPVNEDPDTQSKIQLLESRLAEALEENKLYRAKLQSPTGEGQSDSSEGKENTDDNKIAQLESELKDMQDRFLNMSLEYAEVEAQREQLVMELKSATAKKGRWF